MNTRIQDATKLTKNELFDFYMNTALNAEKLAVGWLETRTENEMVVYQNIVRMAHQIIAEGFSEKVIQPDTEHLQEYILKKYYIHMNINIFFSFQHASRVWALLHHPS